MFVSFLTLFFACGGQSEDTGDLLCSAEVRSSAIISVEDKNGSPLSGEYIQASYTVDGVEGEYIEFWSDGSVVVGGDEAGDFVVELFAEVPKEGDSCCSEIADTVLEFTIEADECHVITQSIDAELEWDVVCVEIEDCG